MPEITRKVSLECPKCQSTELSAPSEPVDTDNITCVSCGNVLSYDELTTANQHKFDKAAD